MHTIKVTTDFNVPEGKFKFSMDLTGDSELEHEVLAALFASGRSVSILPTHEGDILSAEFSIFDKSVFQKAVRAAENRKRKRDNRPTVEEEEAAQKAQKEAEAKAAKAADAD